jgi:hypothetical protein
VVAIVLPLMLGHQEHWPAWLLACIGAGLVLAAAFVAVERRVAARGGHPLTLAAHPVAHASGHALAVTMYWLAAVLALGVVVSIPLTLTVRRARA